MHACDHQLQLEGGIGAQVVQYPPEQAVLGPASGYHADAPGGHRQSASFGLLGTLMTRASIDSATATSMRGQAAYIGSLCMSVQSGRAIRPASFSAASTSSRSAARLSSRMMALSQKLPRVPGGSSKNRSPGSAAKRSR